MATSVSHDPAVRHGKVRWLRDPPHGVARLRVESDAFTALPMSVPDGEPNDGETTPGELLAAAYSAFMATDLAERLERNGVPARELVVDAWCRLSAGATPRSVLGVEVKILPSQTKCLTYPNTRGSHQHPESVEVRTLSCLKQSLHLLCVKRLYLWLGDAW